MRSLIFTSQSERQSNPSSTAVNSRGLSRPTRSVRKPLSIVTTCDTFTTEGSSRIVGRHLPKVTDRANRRVNSKRSAATARPVQREYSPPLARAIRINARSASFTASAFLKAAATSGSRTTTFVLSTYLAWYLPRAAPEKSYSSRIVSLSYWGSAFVRFSFMGCRLAGADDSEEIVLFLSVGDNHEPSGRG